MGGKFEPNVGRFVHGEEGLSRRILLVAHPNLKKGNKEGKAVDLPNMKDSTDFEAHIPLQQSENEDGGKDNHMEEGKFVPNEDVSQIRKSEAINDVSMLSPPSKQHANIDEERYTKVAWLEGVFAKRLESVPGEGVPQFHSSTAPLLEIVLDDLHIVLDDPVKTETLIRATKLRGSD
ncbi:hypothetical protein IEQ34_002752 [Dendrobium chrysotoxum]|uniref:Uncharacterized protein n=1 Tax=Dendrobium chrysotoxum TaxID=161865 RepID=A0AAV7HIN4_DENCH|nr:hypothetical protein IEQ34_002752 [Dendrobium chrysotoxum]